MAQLAELGTRTPFLATAKRGGNPEQARFLPQAFRCSDSILSWRFTPHTLCPAIGLPTGAQKSGQELPSLQVGYIKILPPSHSRQPRPPSGCVSCRDCAFI